LQVIGVVDDGLEAVRMAQQVQPDLILLDIGLPTLNGIEAARRIRELSPKSRILFVSENRSPDIAWEALSTGATGYVVKSDAESELLRAVEAILHGRQFLSASLQNNPKNQQSNGPNRDNVIPFKRLSYARNHEVDFNSDDRHFLDHLTQFIGAALKAGNAAVVVATESHRASLLPRLQAYGVDLSVAIDQGRYIALDAAETLSAFMVNDLPDPVRFLDAFGDLIVTATKAAVGKHPRVSVFGECVHLLWAQGNAEAAIQMEKLGNQLTKIHGVEILCRYSVQGRMDDEIFQRICAEHSAVHIH
jgi:CheY-like chemotaxis protein